MVSEMNSLLKVMFIKVLAEHDIEELSNENLHDEVEREYNKIVEEYHKRNGE